MLLNKFRFGAWFILVIGLLFSPSLSTSIQVDQQLDQRVQSFLENHQYQWRYENIPAQDGKVLYDLIIKNNYKNALDIGTSTGHSAIWMAWALSKTGGKLITVEIDEYRYNKALENFKKAGLSEYIDARLADAHDLVPELEGPFDLVFCDADKNWYLNYLQWMMPKMKVGGCFAAHNVRNLGYMRGIREFLDYIQNSPELETTIDTSSSSGISISYKQK